MRFALDSARVDFAASIDAMLKSADVPGIARSFASGDTRSLRTLWVKLAHLGVTGLTIDPRFDGLGADPVDMIVAVERLGAWAVPGPVVESLVAVPAVLTALGSPGPPRRREWLTGLASGEIIATSAFEPDSPYALDPEFADLVLFVRDDSVSTATVVTVHDSIDPSRRLGEVAPTGDAWTIGAREARARARLMSTLACSAQLLGAGRSVLDMSVAHAKSRRQFGRAIGSFQAVQHRLADVAIALELARPVLYNAALSASRALSSSTGAVSTRAVSAGVAGACRDVSAAKIVCGDAANAASRAALQVHGAIGYTAEYDLSLWITKIRALQSAWGTPSHHRRMVLEAL